MRFSKLNHWFGCPNAPGRDKLEQEISKIDVHLIMKPNLEQKQRARDILRESETIFGNFEAQTHDPRYRGPLNRKFDLGASWDSIRPVQHFSGALCPQSLKYL